MIAIEIERGADRAREDEGVSRGQVQGVHVWNEELLLTLRDHLDTTAQGRDTKRFNVLQMKI